MTATEFERPQFLDGTRLSAEALGTLVKYTRDPLAHHLRTAHTSGIIAGLAFDTKRSTPTLAVFTPGAFIDDYGQLVVVPDPLPIAISPPSDKAVPIFVSAADGSRAGSALALTADCSPSALDAIVESTVGRVGEPSSKRQQPTPGVIAGLSLSEAGRQVSEVLLGYVRLDSGKLKLADTPPPQRAGISTELVRSPSDHLSLVVDGKPGVRFELDADGTVWVAAADKVAKDALLTIDADGNITITGDLTANKVIATSDHQGSEIYIVAGRAFGTVRLPLPSGVKEEDIEPGEYSVTVTLSPVPPPLPAAGTIAPIGVLAHEISADRVGRCVSHRGSQISTVFDYMVTVVPVAPAKATP
jgi:hypothetical protein